MRSNAYSMRIVLILIIFIGGCAQRLPLDHSVVQSAEDRRVSMVKEYLIGKYRPGTCFGLPGPQDDLTRHTIQLKETVLIKNDQGYDFILKDGHCCSVDTYLGIIIMEGDHIIHDKITDKFTKGMPC